MNMKAKSHFYIKHKAKGLQRHKIVIETNFRRERKGKDLTSIHLQIYYYQLHRHNNNDVQREKKGV